MTVHPIRHELDQGGSPPPRQVHRVPVNDSLAEAAAPYDYADAVRVEMLAEPGVTPEIWLSAGLARTPRGVRRVVALLGRSSPNGGQQGPPSVFRVIQSGPDVVLLRADLPTLQVSMIGRATGPSERTLTTVLHFRRRSARLLWPLVAPLHRRAARALVTGGGTPTGGG